MLHVKETMKYFAPGVYLSVIISILFVSCSSHNVSNVEAGNELINIRNLKANLEFLADDLLEGREATTRGEKLSGLFISSELKKYGVLPYYNDYYQRFNLFAASFDQSSFVESKSLQDKNTFGLHKDFYVIRSSGFGDTVQAVFAGFGITAEEFDYDDYAGIDVKDKIIIILPGEPYSTDKNFFDGEEETKYSSFFSKIRKANANGVMGIILLDTDTAGTSWNNWADFLSKPGFSLHQPENKPAMTILHFNYDASSRLMKSEQNTLEEIVNLDLTGQKISSFEFEENIFLSIKKQSEEKESFNIIGVIPGNDPNLKNEFVAIGAHFDHLGITGDVVFNGADDDGSGVVAVLEVGNAFMKTKANKRSILLVFHAAEEKGLFGSEYLTGNLDIMDKIVAQINIDMIGRESIDTLYSVGSDKINPTLKDIVEEANIESSGFVLNYKFDEPGDPEKIYYRSDHYNYAKEGIPVVFFYDNMKDDYHKPTDDVDKINFEKIKKASELIYFTALKIANHPVNIRTNK